MSFLQRGALRRRIQMPKYPDARQKMAMMVKTQPVPMALIQGAATTVESKTNFIAAIRAGEIARAECRPIHKGGTTMVWQTNILRPDGRLAAVVTQTQLVMAARKSSQDG